MSIGGRIKNLFSAGSTMFPWNDSGDLGYSKDKKTDKTTSYDPYLFGREKVSSSNKYQMYNDIRTLDPIVNMGLLELGYTLGKGFAVSVDDKLRKETGKEKMIEKIIEAGEASVIRLKMRPSFCETASLLGQDGTVPVRAIPAGDGKILKIEQLPMPFVTLLPEGIKPAQDARQAKEEVKGYIKGDVVRVVLNEGTEIMDDFTDMDNNYILRIFNSGYITKDILGRDTYGLYGRSLLEPLVNTARFRANLMYSFEKAVLRYGHMKLAYNYNVVAEMLKAGNIDPKTAKKLTDQLATDVADIKDGQEIVAAGVEVESIENKGDAHIMETKAAIDDDIRRGLLGMPRGSGGSGSNTFSSIYVFEQSRILVMQNMARQIKEVYEAILQRDLTAQGIEGAEYVRIKLDPIKEPDILVADMITLHEKGLLGDQQLFDTIGLPIAPMPKEYQDAKRKEAMEEQKEMVTHQAAQKAAYGGDKAKAAQKDSLRDNPSRK